MPIAVGTEGLAVAEVGMAERLSTAMVGPIVEAVGELVGELVATALGEDDKAAGVAETDGELVGKIEVVETMDGEVVMFAPSEIRGVGESMEKAAL